jgi:hypothetical protein
MRLDLTQRLLAPADAAAWLGISDRQLRALTCSGAIRYVNIGLGAKREARRYDPADLAEFMEERRCQSSRGQERKPTRTISGGQVLDFRARPGAGPSGRPNASKKPNGPESRPAGSTEANR